MLEELKEKVFHANLELIGHFHLGKRIGYRPRNRISRHQTQRRQL